MLQSTVTVCNILWAHSVEQRDICSVWQWTVIEYVPVATDRDSNEHHQVLLWHFCDPSTIYNCNLFTYLLQLSIYRERLCNTSDALMLQMSGKQMSSSPIKIVSSQQLDPADDQAVNSRLLVRRQKYMGLKCAMANLWNCRHIKAMVVVPGQHCSWLVRWVTAIHRRLPLI